MAQEISFPVKGYPPAKNEALSILGAKVSHADRVVRLLEAARDELIRSGSDGFGPRPVGVELVVHCPRDGNRGDATNYLGGVADVLEDKAHRGVLEHLGDLAEVSLYDNDHQIEALIYGWERAEKATYTLRFWALDADEQPVDAAAELDDQDGLPPPPLQGHDRFHRERLKNDGFLGWLTFEELRTTKLGQVPAADGVYVVWRSAADEPEFLDANPAGGFKGRDPTVHQDALRLNWVYGAEVVYIGKANSLKRRLGEFQRFGAGVPVGHWGGRLVWQLADSVKLLVAWQPTPGLDARQIESELIAEFRRIYGKPPFANDPHLLGQ